jgi:predicted NUDIX family NTP pyrophosphohydrolase
MSIHSVDVLLFGFRRYKLEVMIVHPDGPFMARKHEGLYDPDGLSSQKGDALVAAVGVAGLR